MGIYKKWFLKIGFSCTHESGSKLFPANLPVFLFNHQLPSEALFEAKGSREKHPLNNYAISSM